MKIWILPVVIAASALAQDEYVAQLRVRVTDEQGAPVSQARVLLSTFNTWVPATEGSGRDEYTTADQLTDTNGVATLALKGVSGRYGYMALPMPGFRIDRGNEYVFTNAIAGRWEPWSPEVTIELKRVGESAGKTNVPAKKETIVSKDPSIGRGELFSEPVADKKK